MRLVLLVAIFISNFVFAKSFTSEFLEFQLPRGWECQLEGSEWVCQSSVDDKKKEAIIILAAKKRGPQDELAKYEAYLKRAKSFALPGGKTQVSEVIYVKQKMIKTQDHPWVDSEHLASEVPGFYTRYLATVKGGLGVAITFSVAKDVRDEYRNLFDSVVETLKVFDKTGSNTNYDLARKKGTVPGAGGEWDDSSIGIDTQVNKGGQGENGKSGSDNTLYLIIAGVVVGGLLLAKKGKKKTKKKKKKKKKKKS